MTTYVIRRIEGRRTPLSDLMLDLPPMPTPSYVPAYGPAKSEFRLRCEAMQVGDEIEVVDRSPKQAQAVANHLRRDTPGVRFSCRHRGTVTVVRRIA